MKIKPGDKFKRLTVISQGDDIYRGKVRKRFRTWNCKCSCGNEKSIMENSLLSGMTTSCGCYQREVNTGRSPGNKRHGLSKSKIYKTWTHMHERCGNPNSKDYCNYGGRGIKVIERWKLFDNFLSDMGDSYSDGLTIDRIDVNDDYRKDNCRWATRMVQNNNRRNNRYVIDPVSFRTMTSAELARKYGLKRTVIKDRLRLGLNGYRLIEPVGIYRLSLPDKKDIKNLLYTHSIFEVSELTRVPEYWLELILDSEVWWDL